MTPRIQLFEASTAYQVMVLAAALDAGAFAPADRRILLVSANTPIPELSAPADRVPGIAALLGRFDEVVSLNDLLAPVHPAAFRPRKAEQPLFERLLRDALRIPAAAALELALESVQAPPARSLLNVFSSAAVTVYAEGLMSYGPTRQPLPPDAASRIRRVLHLDLVAGLAPLLLSEHGVAAETVDEEAFRAVVREVAAAAPPAAPEGPYALVLGQYLAQLGLLSRSAEAALLADLVAAAHGRGFGTVAVKPHPSAPPGALEGAEARAAELGVALVVLRDTTPAEALFETRAPGLVLGCFSTGLITAARFWRIPVVSAGTGEVLAALPRFEDSNRIPLALVERLVPGADGGAVDPPAAGELQRLATTVGYCMQWRTSARWRETAAEALRDDPDRFARSVPRARRRQLALPGGWPLTLSSRRFQEAADAMVRLLAAQLAVTRLLRR